MDSKEIMERANAAKAKASARMQEMLARTQAIQDAADKRRTEAEEQEAEREAERARHAQEQEAANLQRQQEILAQMMGAEFARQSAETEAKIAAEVQKQVGEMAGLGAQELIGKIYGDDMAMLAAAFDTLEQWEGDTEDGEEEEMTSEQLYGFVEEKLAEVARLEELSPAPYEDSPAQWERFGILLSGIISTLNEHKLDELDVEEHIPVMDQQIVSLVRNSWGITGREELLDTLYYLAREGYRDRFERYASAVKAEDLFDEDMDAEEREGVARGWAFVSHFQGKYGSDFLLGWDIGRAAMITRWGYFIGWITRAEAVQLLSDMAQVAANGLGGWREFAQSYIFGGAFWKEVCAADAGQYLTSLTDAVRKLLGSGGDGGQWRRCPWPKPARR